MKINAQKLEIITADRGYTFSKLAQMAGVSRATVSYICNGKKCKAEIGLKLSKALNVPLTELIEEDG